MMVLHCAQATQLCIRRKSSAYRDYKRYRLKVKFLSNPPIAIATFSHLTPTKSSRKFRARESLTTAKEPLKSCSEMNRQKNSVYLAMLLVKPYDKAKEIATKCT